MRDEHGYAINIAVPEQTTDDSKHHQSQQCAEKQPSHRPRWTASHMIGTCPSGEGSPTHVNGHYSTRRGAVDVGPVHPDDTAGCSLLTCTLMHKYTQNASTSCNSGKMDGYIIRI